MKFSFENLWIKQPEFQAKCLIVLAFGYVILEYASYQLTIMNIMFAVEIPRGHKC